MEARTDLRQRRTKVWLHIGMPKTGTTALQTALYQNRDALFSRGFFYPDFGNTQHVAMARMLVRRAGIDVGFPALGSCPESAQFVDYLESIAPDCHHVILSTEYLFQRPGGVPGYKQPSLDDSLLAIRNTAEVTRDYLKDLDVTVVMWLRRQDNWLMSMYNQTVKSSLYVKDFETFANNSIGTHLFEIVSIWVDLFGRNSVLCFSYDSLILQRRDIMKEFASLVGLDYRWLIAEPIAKPDIRNKSLSREGLNLKLLINKKIKSRPSFMKNHALMKSVRKLVTRVSNQSAAWPHALLSPDERLNLVMRFMNGNAKLVSEHGYTDLSGLSDISDLVKLKESGGWQAWPAIENDKVIEALLSFALSENPL